MVALVCLLGHIAAATCPPSRRDTEALSASSNARRRERRPREERLHLCVRDARDGLPRLPLPVEGSPSRRRGGRRRITAAAAAAAGGRPRPHRRAGARHLRDGGALAARAIAERTRSDVVLFTLFATALPPASVAPPPLPGHVRACLVLATARGPRTPPLPPHGARGRRRAGAPGTDFLAELAGLPSHVCAEAQALAGAVDFDRVAIAVGFTRTRGK